jgi:hypothetical protein
MNINLSLVVSTLRKSECPYKNLQVDLQVLLPSNADQSCDLFHAHQVHNACRRYKTYSTYKSQIYVMMPKLPRATRNPTYSLFREAESYFVDSVYGVILVVCILRQTSSAFALPSI